MNVRVHISDRVVSIPVSDGIYAYWNEQFVRPYPTPAQRKRYATLMNVVRAAYLKGLDDRKKP